MKNPMRTTVIALSMAVAAFGADPAFEAASIKPNKSGSGSSSINTAKGSLTMKNMSLQGIVAAAYHIKEQEVAGPSWLDGERFDIVARAAQPVSDPELMLMVRTLLAERFGLQAHKESRQVSGYALTIVRSGLKLVEVAAGDGSRTNTGRGRLEAEKIPMPRLADALSRIVRLPVVDQTGRTGVFNVKLEWTPDDSTAIPMSGNGAPPPAADAPTGPSLLTALQEQAGLKLEGRKVPIDILVIDSVARVPTEN